MFRVAVLRPAEPRADALFVLLDGDRRGSPVQAGGCSTKISFYRLSDLRLIMIKHEPDEIQSSTVFVVFILGYRENLIIPFQGQVEFSAQILVDESTKLVENLF